MIIDDVFTIKEAAALWNVAADTIKKSCAGQKGLPPRFENGEFRKSGSIWLVTRAGMNRLFGDRT